VEDLRKAGKELERNEFARLLDMGDGVALLEFHFHPTSWRLANSIDAGTVAMADLALARLASDFDALVIGNDGRNFSLGANLPTVVQAIEQGTFDALARTIRSIADVALRLRQASKPVVSAPHGVTVGAGLVLAMSGRQSVAAMDTYMGLAEAALGVIPAGGGCKETLRVRVNPAARTPGPRGLPDLDAAVRAAFAQLANSVISMSALEAQPLGYLQPQDTILMNSDYVLATAKAQALALARSEEARQGALGAAQVEPIYAAGRAQLAALKAEIERQVAEGSISEFDGVIQRKLAYVVCGGDLPAPVWVEPAHIFDLETEAFLSLLGEAKTKARLTHFLATGKLLRN
jgi:3-hydroxyacyl-CoA dehydrogenase